MSIVEKFIGMEYGPAPEDQAKPWVGSIATGAAGHFIKGAWQEPAAVQYF